MGSYQVEVRPAVIGQLNGWENRWSDEVILEWHDWLRENGVILWGDQIGLVKWNIMI